MLIDRSADEKDPKGQLEWLKLYGILFGKEKESYVTKYIGIKELVSISEEDKKKLGVVIQELKGSKLALLTV